MKKFIPLLLLVLVICGCQELAPKESNQRSQLTTTSNEYTIIVIDSCQYILMGMGDTQTLTHKGNCNNPYHQK